MKFMKLDMLQLERNMSRDEKKSTFQTVMRKNKEDVLLKNGKRRVKGLKRLDTCVKHTKRKN